MKALCLALFFFSAPAFANASACVVYVTSRSVPAVVQYSCDGENTKDLFQAPGVTAALSKTIQYFTGLDYAFHGCTDAFNPGTSASPGFAYTRCFFVRGQ